MIVPPSGFSYDFANGVLFFKKVPELQYQLS